MQAKRYREIDGLRAIAAAAVVMIHASSGYTEYFWGMPLNQLSRFAVPLFIMLAGFGGGAPKALEEKGHLKRRLWKLAVPYLLWSCIYLALDWILGNPHPHPIYDLFTGSAYVHLYFLFVLMQLEVVHAWFAHWAMKHPKAALLSAIMLTFGLQCLTLIEQLYGKVFFALPIPLTRLFPLYLFFYVAGFLIRGKYETWRHASKKRLAFAGLLWFLSIVLVLVIAQHKALRIHSMRPDLALYTLTTAFVVQQGLLLIKSERIHRALGKISVLSFGLYLVHPLLLRLVIVSGILYGRRMLVCIPVLFAVGMIGGLLFSKLFSSVSRKIRYNKT